MSCLHPIKLVIDRVEAESPSGSDQDIIDTLQLLLSKGITASTEEDLCCTCSPDTDFPYIVASVETFLKFAEAVGLTNSLFFEQSTLTQGPIPKNSFVRIINYVSGDNFIPYVNQDKDSSGVPNTNGFMFWTNNVMNWFNGTTLEYTYSGVFDPNECNASSGCCRNVMASVETFLKYAEAVGETGSNGTTPIENSCNNYKCCEFRNSCEKYSDIVFSAATLDRILDKGIVELGDSGMNYLFEYYSGRSQSFISDYTDIFLDKGVATYCPLGVRMVLDVETILKYAEAVGLTQSNSTP